MLIHCITVGHLETNCYLLADETTADCAVIDPGDESNAILDAVESAGLRVTALLLTHGHFDHTGAVESLQEETGAPVWMHALDAADAPGEDFRFFPPKNARFYAEGDTIPVGSLSVEVLETPGHSRGSVTLRCGDALFTGDTLFRDSVGRTDLPGGDLKTLMSSLLKLDALDGKYDVYPGHMEQTTLSRERSVNPYLSRAGEVR